MPENVTFDHYSVLTRADGSLHELGRGSMGITYKAFDTNLRIPVALKVINVPDLTSELARAQFVQEARAAARLRHRHVASVFHLGVQGDTYFYAMEFIGGETVEALVKRRGPLPELIALQIALQVTRALAAADQHTLVHRDIKPSNLMLVHEDDELCAKVIDFGLAMSQLSEEEGGSSVSTSSAGFMGTPQYASPEQLEEGVIDHRSDLYSLGATLWYMLAGAPPFTGPVARVVSQHLSSEPPYDHLGGCSPETIAILRKLLAKKVEDRFQKAVEVRQAIEHCSEVLAGGPVAAAARIALEEARVTPQPAADREVGDYPSGSSIADRYEVEHALGASNHGWIYHARDVVAAREVRLMLVDVDPNEDRAVFTQLEHEMEALTKLDHPSLLRVFGMETVDHRVLISLQWTNGVTLLQLLRSRRKLGAGEVIRLLQMMAEGVDHAITHGLARLDLALHQIHVDFPGPPLSEEEQLRKPVDEWPPFQLKLNPMSITREIAESQTWAGGQTLVGVSTQAAIATTQVNPGVAHARALAVLIYELLGGSVSPLLAAKAGLQGITRYSPLANLTEEGNEILRSALDPDGPFRYAGEFYRALAAIDELEDRHHEKSDTTKRPEGFSVGEGAGTVSIPAVVSEPATHVALPPPKRAPWALIAVAAVMVVGGSAAYFGLQTPEKPHPRPPLVTPGPTPDTVPDATPVAVTHNPATPVATPSRRDLLKAAKETADKIEEEGDTFKTIAAWMEVARKFPESEIGKLHLETTLDALRPKAGQFAGAELTQLEEMLREVAKLDVASAMMMLGDLGREKQPVESFKWFSAAAAKGVPAAATQVGLMLSNGMGVERDLYKAVEYFQSATAKGDAGAMAALGECLLTGKGVERDVPHAIDLLQQAAARSNVRALSRLGTCYHQGLGVKQDYDEARRLFLKAVDLGSNESLGNLGVLYMNGDGVPKSARKAVEYFQRGAEAGDGYCMYLYARCFEAGTGVTPNPGTAQSWYKKAAAIGIIRAMDWCRKNNVEF